jgi:hypothetical protein
MSPWIHHREHSFDVSCGARGLQESDATVSRSSQELWDEVVRRWPALAAEIMAGAQPAG